MQLAKLAKEAGVRRFVFSSSCSTYGAAGDHFLDETAQLSPVTAYAESKVYVERDVRTTRRQRLIPPFMRNATACRASPVAAGHRLEPSLASPSHYGARVTIKSDGTPWRPIVHIRDIIAAVVSVLEAPQESIHILKPSTSDELKRTTASASWPTSSPRPFPDAKSNTPRAAGLTSAAIG